MVKQGTIIVTDFNPTRGHEQQKVRPALVVSNNDYNRFTGLVIVLPISHAKEFPTHIPLPDGYQTDGKVLCEHVRALDIEARGYKEIETVEKEFLQHILDICKMEF